MKTLRLFLLALITSIAGTALAGNLTVNITPAQAASAGGQWRVDGGNWRNSGVTVKNLSNAAHTVEYKALTGWIAPASTSVTLTNNVTTTVTGTYVQPASIAVTLTPSTGQWRIDGGAWRSSGAMATGLIPGAHTIGFSSIAGMLPLAPESISLPAGQVTSINRSFTAEAGLIVNLTPASTQWRVDGGPWQAGGSRIGQLSAGNHTIDYSLASGYAAPPSENVALVAGQTTTINRNYAAVSAVTMNLTPSSASWQIDGGTWQASGATVTGLTPGNHTIAYSTVTGMLPLPSETVNLPGTQTTSLARSYTAEAGLVVNLTPSTAQWRIDAGAWRASGERVGQLTAGNHSIEYNAAAGHVTPASESITLSTGETTTVTRTYAALASLTVNLTPSTARWELDGGNSRASGATATGLTPGNHTIVYYGQSAMISPATESITLAAGENASITRSYTPAGQIFVMLNPTTAQWRVDGGVWRASHTYTGWIAEGTHLLEYSSIEGKVTPTAETVNVVAGQTLQVSRSYNNESFLTINLTPSTAQWRVDGGAWHNSGERVAQLSATGHTVDYSIVEGYAALPAETVVLYSGQTTTLSRTYTLPPARLTVNLSDPNGWWQADSSGWRNSGQTINVAPGSHTISYLNTAAALAPSSETLTLQPDEEVTISRDYTPAGQVYVTLNPSTAQWRVDGGTWSPSATYSGLIAAGTHTLEYSAVATRVTPTAETINIVAGQNLTVSRAYQTESFLTINLTPAAGQWRVDGGSWRNSGETVGQLTGGNHTVDYTSAAGYVAPVTETVSLATGQTTTLTRSYTIPLTVNLSDPNGRWQADTSGWRTSGQTIYLAPGDHSISYLDTVAAIAPASETLTLQAGPAVTISRDYTPAGQVRVTLDPSTAQWRIDGGAWRASATYSGLIAEGPHLLEYSSATERVTPAAETINVTAGQTLQVSKVYAGDASLTINLTPSSGQWRVNGGVWHNSGERVELTAGGHTVDYASVDGYAALPAETVFFDSGETMTLSRTYPPLPARLTVNLNDPNGRWKADFSGWYNSGQTVNLPPGSHTISYLNTTMALGPASETLTLQSNEEVTISREYTPAGRVLVTLNPSSALWRVDNGGWQTSPGYSGLLAPGAHTIQYSLVATKVTPPTETINIVAGQDLSVSRTYATESFLTVTLTPPVGQWRIDGGEWRSSGGPWGQMAVGSHLIEYSAVSGYTAPPAETVVLTTGGGTTLTRSYLRPASLTVALNQAEGQWRINNGPWQASGATLSGLRPGSYTIQFSSIAGYFDIYDEVITLAENQNKSVTSYYNPQASLTMTLTPGNATWRLNGGAWQASGATVTALWAGEYTIEYSPVDGMTAPPSESFFLNLGEQKTLSRSYRAPPSLSVTLTPAVGQWRVDTGAWQMSGNVISDLTPGAHLIEYTDAPGYITPPAETFTASNYGPTNLTRAYRDASTGHLNVNVVPARFSELGLAKWRVDGGEWNTSGETVALSPGSHTLEFQPVAGLDVPQASTVTATAGTVETLEGTYYMPHRLRFFLHGDLVTGLSTVELQARLSQYAAHLKTIWDRESFRRFVFDPATDITIVWWQPFTSPSTPLPEYGFEVWAHAVTGTSESGGIGGYPNFDGSGAAGVGGMHWLQIYDPSTLAPGSPELSDYWKQIDTMTREFERIFGAGLGDYGSARLLPDLTGVAPFSSVDYSTAADPFWNAHSDFWRDPLLGSAWGNYRLDNPTSLPALLEAVRFSETSREIINGCYRNAAFLNWQMMVPDLSHVRVTVVDASTGQPISGAMVRMWHRPSPTGSPGAEEWVQPIFELAGTFEFSWTGANQWNPFNSYDNAKLLKAYAPGYQPKAQWEWLYDAQRLKIVDNSDVWEITVALEPAP
jgi:hypothetical protein